MFPLLLQTAVTNRRGNRESSVMGMGSDQEEDEGLHPWDLGVCLSVQHVSELKFI